MQLYTEVNELQRYRKFYTVLSCALTHTHPHSQSHNVVTDKMIKWQQSADYKKWFTVNRCCVIINKRNFVRVMNQTACPNAAVCVTEPHQGAFIIPGKLVFQPRGENDWLNKKLRLSHSDSLITSKRFKVSSRSKKSSSLPLSSLLCFNFFSLLHLILQWLKSYH